MSCISLVFTFTNITYTQCICFRKNPLNTHITKVMTLWSATYELVKQPSKDGWIMAVIALGILAIVTAIQFIVSFTIFGNLTVAGNMFLRGNLGIGTDDPQAKLHVVGDVIFEGDFVL